MTSLLPTHIISSASPPPRPGVPWAEQGRTPSGGGPDGSFFQRAEALCSHHAVLLWLREDSMIPYLQGCPREGLWATRSPSGGCWEVGSGRGSMWLGEDCPLQLCCLLAPSSSATPLALHHHGLPTAVTAAKLPLLRLSSPFVLLGHVGRPRLCRVG